MFIRRLLVLAGIILMLGAAPAFAQDPVVATPAPVTTTTTGDNTTVVLPDEATTVETGDNTTVVVPVGSWIEQLTAAFRDTAIALAGLALLWASRLLPEGIRQYINAERIKAAEQLLGKGVDAAFNAVKGATKGMEIKVDVGSKLVAAGAQYAVDNGPSALIAWLGGAEGVKAKIAARLVLANDTTTKEVLAATPPVTGKS